MEKVERDEIVDKVILEALRKTSALSKWSEDYKIGIEAHWGDKRPVKEGGVAHIVRHAFRNLVNHALKHLDWAGMAPGEKLWIRVGVWPAGELRNYRLVASCKDNAEKLVLSAMSTPVHYWRFTEIEYQSWSELGNAVRSAWKVYCKIDALRNFGNPFQLEADVIYGLLVDEVKTSIGHGSIMEITNEASFQRFLAVASHMGLKCPHVLARMIEKDEDRGSCFIRWSEHRPESFECEGLL